jgi:predicted DNA-binding protein YlxM (UPF0122 family)
MWLAGYSQDEIAEKAGITKETVSQRLKSCQILESFPKPDKLAAEYNGLNAAMQCIPIPAALAVR